MMDYNEILGDVSKEKFRSTMNKLLNECFILKKLNDTSSDYRFIMANQSVFEDILDLLGYELVVRDDQGVITINNPSGIGRIHFSKLESIIILILRLLYIEKMKEVSQIQDVIVILEEIYERYAMLQLGKLRKDQLLNALRSYKRLNLLRNIDRMDSGDPGVRIMVFPSILLAITAVSLEETYKLAQAKLNEYANGGECLDTGEELEEDSDQDSID